LGKRANGEEHEEGSKLAKTGASDEDSDDDHA
jgi:hypothetical protein